MNFLKREMRWMRENLEENVAISSFIANLLALNGFPAENIRILNNFLTINVCQGASNS